MTHHTGSVPETKRKPDWRDDAACREEDSEAFFANSATSEGKLAIQHAKSICARCPSQVQCGQWALETRQAYGVWGGLSEDERRRTLRIRIKDGDAEPRKGGRPRAKCGTASAYDRHVKYGEPIDDACRAAHTAASAEQRARARQKAAAKKRQAAA
jgi:hypothetical protein